MHTSIQFDHPIGPLPHFWNSTGFSPAELLLTQDMQQALTYYGSIPHGDLTYARIHFLLELVHLAGQDGDRLQFDWSLLDEGLDWLVRNHLKPFFEIMGNPGDHFTDFKDDRQLRQWKDMVTQLALHLQGRYGQAEVESWYFESCNEPDAAWWTQDETAWCNYYDACSEGLKTANPRLVFGGPGTCRTLSSMFKTAMAHCDNGTNYFTGEQGVRLDFITVHEKGAIATPDDINPDSTALWQREARAVEYIRAHHPRLAGLPFINNEADPQVGWANIHTWHARPYYAALACKMIQQHLRGLADGMGVNYALLGNDNGFLGTWGNRTLLARFGDAGLLDEGQSKHKPRLVVNGQSVYRFAPFELIKKPILNAWALLSLLGDTRCLADPLGAADDELGVIASRRGADQVAVLVYHSRDRVTSSGSDTVTLHLSGLPFEEAVLAHYRIDEAHGDPFQLWEKPTTGERAAPPSPSPALFAAMRRRQELESLAEPHMVQPQGGALDLSFDLPLHAVSLLLLSARPQAGPAQVSGVRLQPYTGLCQPREVMVTWQGLDSRMLRTYEVLRAPSPEGPFERINQADLLCTAYLDASPEAGQPACYRVRAVDYWNRPGTPSEIINQ